MNQDVNYRIQRRYNTARFPIRQPLWVAWLIRLLSKIALSFVPHTVEKVNMEGIKPPYILLCNHFYFIDFELCAKLTWPHRVNNVVTIDGYYRRPWLMELIGAICTRKFTMDLHLIKSIRHVLKKGDILCMYPEARYSPCGTNAYLPESLGKLIKMNQVPVVMIKHHGNHLYAPFWNFRKKRKVPLHSVMSPILTAEDVKRMSTAEINDAVNTAMEYDEYRWQKEQGILISEPYRAEGLHKVLYQCPHCLTESKMATQGTELFCAQCGKRWNLNEDGTLSALAGETEFSHVPDWFEWQRGQVAQQIENGTYSFEDEVDVYSMPRCWRFIHLGAGKLRHDPENGFVLEGTYRKQAYRIQRTPKMMNGLHVEYDYCYLRPEDCLDISTENDSFYCYPKKQNVITKLAFATEIIYQRAMKR